MLAWTIPEVDAARRTRASPMVSPPGGEQGTLEGARGNHADASNQLD